MSEKTRGIPLIAGCRNYHTRSMEALMLSLKAEGYISDFDLEERWFKSVVSEDEVRARMQEMIDDDVNRIKSIELSCSRYFDDARSK